MHAHLVSAASHPPNTTGELVFAACCVAVIMLIAAGVLWYTARSRR